MSEVVHLGFITISTKYIEEANFSSQNPLQNNAKKDTVQIEN
jgi:hypothetical protein